MIHSDTHDAYFRDTASRRNLILASHQVSHTIDLRRPRGLSPEQLQLLRQDTIQTLRERQQDLYQLYFHLAGIGSADL